MKTLIRKSNKGLRTWDPRDLMPRSLDDWFDSAFEAWPAFRMPFMAPVRGPMVDVEDKGDHYLVTADLPGMDKKELSVSLEEGVVVIEGKREGEKKENDGKHGYLRSERYYGSFRRAIALPGEVKADAAVADYDKGVLTLKLPKAAETRAVSKVIPIG